VRLPDTNIWLALALSEHEFHDVARDWFATQSEPRSVLFCRATQQSFLRLLTTDKLMRLYGVPPLSNAGAWALWQEYCEDQRVTLAAEPAGLESHWSSLAVRSSASPKLWMDAYLAAFAIAGGHTLVTTDRAFAQFKTLDALILDRA
jgi:toxin-antitoxin system PIN domain toxin